MGMKGEGFSNILLTFHYPKFMTDLSQKGRLDYYVAMTIRKETLMVNSKNIVYAVWKI